jgi:hypothetical protein
VTTKRLEFSPKTKILACIRYNPELAEYAEGLTNEKAKALLPYLLKHMTCPGLFEINLKCKVNLGSGCQFDHIMRNEIKPDNSVENCRPSCPACHGLKTVKIDALGAARGRSLRRETKKSQQKAAMKGKHFRTGAKIQSRGFPSPEERRAVKEKLARVR